jgi:hypothetical protein
MSTTSPDGLIARDRIYCELMAARDAGKLVSDDFEIARSYVPATHLEDFPDAGACYIVPLSAGEPVRQSRNAAATRESAVQIGFRRRVEPTDIDTLDDMVTLVEQLRDVVRGIRFTSLTWVRNEPLVDERGTPFAYTSLRQNGYFENYFTAYYQRIVKNEYEETAACVEADNI